MICNNCGNENRTDSKFCSHCGAELKKRIGRYCTSCGSENEDDAIFCSNCGTKITDASTIHHHASNKPASPHKALKRAKGRTIKTRNKSIYVLPAVAGIGLIIVLVLLSRGTRTNVSQNRGQVTQAAVPVSESVLSNPVEESKAIGIASKFDCSCGTCNELPLETCTCPTAAEERGFIRDMVKSGKTSAEIVAAVYRTYGHKKLALDVPGNSTLSLPGPQTSNNSSRTSDVN